MNVWIVNESAYKKKESGSTRHFNLANNLKKNNIKTLIIAGSIIHNSREQRIKSKKNFLLEKVDNVNFLWVKLNDFSGRYKFNRIFLMLQFLFKIIFMNKLNSLSKPDIIIGSSPTLLSALAGYLLSKKYKAKFVYEVRDLWLLSLQEIGVVKRNSLFCFIINLIDTFLANNSQKIIILFKGAKEFYKKKGIKSEKFLFIPNGTNHIPYLKNKSRKQDDIFKIFYLGSHSSFNDLFNILKAFKIIQNIKLGFKINLYLYGDGSERNNLINFAKEQNLTNIFFKKPLNRNELIKKRNDADGFIFSMLNLPNLYKYGLSFNKIYEYMIMSRPIVFTSCTNNLPRDKKELGVFAPTDNPKKLALAIVKLACMPSDKREKMSLNNYEFVCNSHIYSKLSSDLAKSLIKIHHS